MVGGDPENERKVLSGGSEGPISFGDNWSLEAAI
jgi:hypothetical protein